MKNYIAIIAFCLLFTSCATVTYFGDRLTPTTTIDVFYSAHDVKRDYKVIGHMTVPNFTKEEARTKLVEYAKSVGADAIVINGTESTKDTQSAYVNADALKYN
jgi:hypothetical protein